MHTRLFGIDDRGEKDLHKLSNSEEENKLTIPRKNAKQKHIHI